MSVSLNKGDRVELSKDSRVNAVSVCLGWDTAKYDDDGDFDLDASAFVIGRNGMTRRDEDFIFTIICSILVVVSLTVEITLPAVEMGTMK